jgi:hypothetical protein
MGRPRLPCDDPVLAASRAAARQRVAAARAAARKCARAEVEPPRVLGAVIFDTVVCARCGDVFRGPRPLFSYGYHRSTYCPWFNADEKAAHDTLVAARANTLAVEYHRRVRQPKEPYVEIPALHTGHELFERARAARSYWPQPSSVLAFPIWEDVLSEGVVAILEDRDPAVAMKQFLRCQGPPTLSLDAALPGSDRTLLDVLAA